MSFDRFLDHVTRAAAWRAWHAVPPWAAVLFLVALVIWIAASRARRP